MRRVDDPGEHVFAVRGLLPARHDRRALYLRVDVIVLVRELRDLFL